MTDNTMVKRKKNKTTTNGRQNSTQKTTDWVTGTLLRNRKTRVLRKGRQFLLH